MGHSSVDPLCLLEQKVPWANQLKHLQRAFSLPWENLRSGTCVLIGLILWGGTVFQNQSAGESRNDKITLGFFFVCVNS